MPGIDINTKFISHWNGQNGAKEIIDDGNTRHSITLLATAQLDASTKIFGSSSMVFDGNSDSLVIPDSTDWDIMQNNTDTHTIDFWVKLDNPGGPSEDGLIAHTFANLDRWFISRGAGSTAIQFSYRTTALGTIVNLFSGAGTLNDTNFHHVMCIVIGTGSTKRFAIYIDGQQLAYEENSANANYTGLLNVGSRDGTAFLDGHMEEVRIQKSNPFGANPNVGLTDTITVPVIEHISDINTKLLLHMDSHDISGDGGSNNYHFPSFVATAQIDTAINKFGNASLFLDGNSDFVSIPDSVDWDFTGSNLDNWTIDLWVKHDITGIHTLITQAVNETNRWTLEWDGGVGGGYRFLMFDNSVTSSINTGKGGPTVTDNNFHHIALIKVGDVYAIYFDGNQVNYVQSLAIRIFSAPLTIGARNGIRFMDGNMDEVRIQQSNIFAASPNIGLTDTITVPVIEYDIISTILEDFDVDIRILKESISDLDTDIRVSGITVIPGLTISRSSSGANIQDRLINDKKGINHGDVTNNVTTLEEIFFIRHNGVNVINNLKLHLDGLAEILQWADDNAGDGLLLDSNNDATFETNFKTGVGDSLANAINLGDLNPLEEKIIVVKIKIPGGESIEGIRNFNLNFNFDFTS